MTTVPQSNIWRKQNVKNTMHGVVANFCYLFELKYIYNVFRHQKHIEYRICREQDSLGHFDYTNLHKRNSTFKKILRILKCQS